MLSIGDQAPGQTLISEKKLLILQTRLLIDQKQEIFIMLVQLFLQMEIQ